MVEENINMSDAKKVIGKNGKEYLQKTVLTVEVPEEYKGKFLMLNSKTGEVMYKVPAPVSEEQKKAKAQARFNEIKKKYAEQVKINKEASAEIVKTNKEISKLKKQIAKDAVKGKDVSGLQEKRNVLETKVIELRDKKKPVPKKYK